MKVLCVDVDEDTNQQLSPSNNINDNITLQFHFYFISQRLFIFFLPFSILFLHEFSVKKQQWRERKLMEQCGVCVSHENNLSHRWQEI